MRRTALGRFLATAAALAVLVASLLPSAAAAGAELSPSVMLIGKFDWMVRSRSACRSQHARCMQRGRPAQPPAAGRTANPCPPVAPPRGAPLALQPAERSLAPPAPPGTPCSSRETSTGRSGAAVWTSCGAATNAAAAARCGQLRRTRYRPRACWVALLAGRWRPLAHGKRSSSTCGVACVTPCLPQV